MYGIQEDEEEEDEKEEESLEQSTHSEKLCCHIAKTESGVGLGEGGATNVVNSKWAMVMKFHQERFISV